MARQRDYVAEGIARKARAAAKGLTGQEVWGHRKRAAAAEVRKAEKRAQAAVKKAAAPRAKPKAQPLKRQLAPDVDRITTRDGRALMRALRDGAAKGHNAAITVTLKRKGGGYRTATTDRNRKTKPGDTALRLAGDLRVPPHRILNRAGRVPDDGNRPDGPAPGGKAVVLIGPRQRLAPGSIPCADLVEYLSLYVNPWDGVYDLIGEGDL